MKDIGFPDFLGIGAQKCGTTWLWRNLSYHPEIWMPPAKELHYFNTRQHNDSFSLGKRLFGNGLQSKRWRMRFSRRLKADFRPFDLKALRWDIRYFLGRRDARWYGSLFKQGHGKITGEITPAYSILDEDAIATIFELMPDLKIIFLMRDPIERAWSQARFSLGQTTDRPIESVPEEELIRHINSASSLRRGDYIRTLDHWSKYYPQEQFFVGFMEDIAQHPEKMLLDIFQFLGVETSDRHVSPKAHFKRGVSKKAEIPHRIARYLAQLYQEPLRLLDARFGGYASTWRQRAQALLAEEIES